MLKQLSYDAVHINRFYLLKCNHVDMVFASSILIFDLRHAAFDKIKQV